MRIRLALFTFAFAAVLVFPKSTHASINKTLGSYDTPGTAQDVVVVGNYAYVADGDAGVTVLDITNPATPILTGAYNTPGNAKQVDVSSNNAVLFVADDSSVQVLSLATPATPTLLGSYAEPGLTVNDVSTDGSHAYVLGVLNGSSIVEALNVTNPASPSINGALSVHASNAITLSGNYAYIVGGTLLDVISIANFPSMALTGTYTDAYAGSLFSGIQVFGSQAYINDPVNGLHAVSIGNPSAPVASYQSPVGTAYGSGVAVSNGYVFLNMASGGLAVFDVATTGLPVYVDTYEGSATGLGVTIANDVAFLANGAAGLQAINVVKPDTVPPVVTQVGNPVITIEPGKKFVDPGVTVTDNVGGTLTNQTRVNGAVDTSKVGTYVLTYITTDRAGNTTTIKRTVYVAPTLTSLVLQNNRYTLLVGKKKVILNPFPGYRGAIVAKKAVVNTKNDPLYFFIPKDTLRKPEIVIYNSLGRVVKRENVTGVSKTGLQVELASNPKTASIYIALAAKKNVLKVSVFNLSKGGIKLLKVFTTAGGKGTLLMRFLKTYDQEFGLVTNILGSTKTPYVWRYAGGKKSWYRDTTFNMSLLKWTKTTIGLK